MQVSWIEPDEVRALAALLQDAGPRTAAGSWDVQTLPDAAALPESPLLVTEPTVAARPQPLPLPPPSVNAQVQPPVAAPPAPVPQFAPAAPVIVPPVQAGPEVALIRETLRVIRDRARQAGLLQDEPPPVPVPPPAPVPLSAPPAPPAPSVLDSLPPVSSFQPPAVQTPEHAQPPASVTPAPPTSSFLPLEGTLSERLEHFTQWATQLSTSQEIFLLDDHGGLLWGRPSHPEATVAAMLAVQGALRDSAGSSQVPPAFFTVPVAASDAQLSVIPCSTRFGLVTLVLLGAGGTSMTPETAESLREALLLTVEAGGS